VPLKTRLAPISAAAVTISFVVARVPRRRVHNAMVLGWKWGAFASLQLKGAELCVRVLSGWDLFGERGHARPHKDTT